MPRWAAKVDNNQAEIVEALRAAGAVVEVCSRVGQGFADLVVGKHGRVWFMEVKADGGKLTEPEREFMARWSDNYAIVRSVDEALRVIGAIE